MSRTFQQIESSVREQVESGDDRCGFNRYWMSLVVGELDRVKGENERLLAMLERVTNRLSAEMGAGRAFSESENNAAMKAVIQYADSLIAESRKLQAEVKGTV